jgi:hypothetical protein
MAERLAEGETRLWRAMAHENSSRVWRRLAD